MTNPDELTGDALAEAIEPKPLNDPCPDAPDYFSSFGVWKWDRGYRSWLRQPFYGNAAISLLKEIERRGWDWQHFSLKEWCHHRNRATASKHGMGQLHAQADDFPTAIARIFLKIVEREKTP